MKTFFRQWQRKACGGDEKHQRRKAHEYLKDELGNGKKAAQTRQYTSSGRITLKRGRQV